MRRIKSWEKKFVETLRFSRKRLIGAEIELLAIKKDNRAISWKQTRELFRQLSRLKGWEPIKDKPSGPIIGVKNSIAKYGFNDYIATDTGYCLIEIALAPELNIHKIKAKYQQIVRILIRLGKDLGIRFLGYGIQPISRPSIKLVTPRTRYLFFARNKIKLRKIKPANRMYSTIIAANQSNINLKNETEATEALNVMLGLVPVQIALFANSPISQGKIDEYKERRSAFWYGSNKPWQYGMPSRPFIDLEDYFRTIWSVRAFLVRREGKLYKIEVETPFARFLEYGGDGRTFDGKLLKNIPANREDIEYHNGFIWWDARIKTPQKTTYLEIRPCATQPPGEQMAVYAFHLGIIENLERVKKILNQFRWEDLLNARHTVLTSALAAKIKDQPVIDLCQKVLAAAEQGLLKRKLGEEIYLQPLWQRIKTKKSPADRALAIFRKGGIKALIKEFTLDESELG